MGSQIQHLSAERDLVRIPHRDEGAGLLALGGASFDDPEGSLPSVRSHEPADSAATRGVSRRRDSSRGPQPECLEFRDTRFAPLPWTAREVEEIASAWGDPSKTVTLTGTNAGETALKALAPGRRVLHLATHGFFLDASRCAPEWSAATRGIGGVAGGSTRRVRTHSRSSSPLLISGLALAGANRRLRAKPDQEDGVLMAEEIVSLDLSKTEWVVLSACETGLGKLQAGEGILGLQRAFQAAGAGTVIMSLWEVEDRSTREWMRQLYESRFRRKRSTAEAVREADLAVLRDRRAQGLGTHPFYWAGFVATGDWR
jgi:CHAT domain-containing protein